MMVTLQALKAIKLRSGVHGDSAGQLRLFDGKTLQWRTLCLNRYPHYPCPRGRVRALRDGSRERTEAYTVKITLNERPLTLA